MGIMKKLTRTFVLLMFTFLCGCMRQHNDKSVQIKGSDTIVCLVQKLAEDFTKQYPKLYMSVTGGGSGTGIASLINKTCDIAMSSRIIEKKEKTLAENKNIKLIEFKIGFDALAIIVNKNNTIDKLTLEQLRNIFMAKITNWKELGGENKKIVILSRESNSGTHVFFKKHVLRYGNENAKDEFSTHSLMLSSSQTIYNEIYRNSNALGYVGMGFVNKGVKAIPIAMNAKSEYIYPSPENVMNGSYPISRPLYLYTKTSTEEIVKIFIRYALSDIGQKIILQTGFVPI
jgi:phosphate transport system substrate-binding protein